MSKFANVKYKEYIYTHTVKQIDFQQRFDARTRIYTCNFAFVSLARCYPTR